jgi:hypothetical protein
MVPVIGQERLALSAEGIGLLASMEGVRALPGAGLIMAVARRPWHGYLYVGGVFLFLATVPVFALSLYPVLTGAALLVLGLGQSGLAVMQTTLVFTSAPPDPCSLHAPPTSRWDGDPLTLHGLDGLQVNPGTLQKFLAIVQNSAEDARLPH